MKVTVYISISPDPDPPEIGGEDYLELLEEAWENVGDKTLDDTCKVTGLAPFEAACLAINHVLIMKELQEEYGEED